MSTDNLSPEQRAVIDLMAEIVDRGWITSSDFPRASATVAALRASEKPWRVVNHPLEGSGLAKWIVRRDHRVVVCYLNEDLADPETEDLADAETDDELTARVCELLNADEARRGGK